MSKQNAEPKLSKIEQAMDILWAENRTFGIDQNTRPVVVFEDDMTQIRFVVEVEGKDYHQHIARTFRNHTGKILLTAEIKQVQHQLAAEAQFSGNYIEVSRRFASISGENRVLIDVYNEEGTVLDINAGHVHVTTLREANANFIMNERMKSLPIYLPGQADWRMLRNYVHLAIEEMYPLLMAQMGQMIVRLGPYVMACFVGQAGSGKSEAARFVSELIDPSSNPLQNFTGNEKDIAITTLSSALLVFDNVEPFTKADSNVLCRLTTGSGIRCRKLFSDTDEIILKLSSPVIVTSIDPPIRTDDLMDRSITYQFKRIPPNQRKTMKALFAEFECDKHFIFSALIDMVALALNNLESVEVESLPRMADFAKFACACAPYFGLTGQQMLDLYAASQSEMVIDVADESAFIRALHRFITRNKEAWQGSTTDLLKALEFYAEANQKGWPQSSVSAGKMLARYSEVLNKLGIDCQRIESHRRQLRLSKLPHFQPSEDQAEATPIATSIKSKTIS